MKIEELIAAQKSELDVESPPPELWDQVKKDWQSKPKSEIHWWKIAAMLFITSSIGLLIYVMSLQKKVEELASLGDISEHYKEMELNYLSEINVLESSISIQEASQNEELAWMIDEMETLEEINEMYRKDIGQLPDETQLVNALIDYYEKKIKLLKKLELEISRIQKFKKDEKDHSDRISI